MSEVKKDESLDDAIQQAVSSATKKIAAKYITAFVLLVGFGGFGVVGTGGLERAARPNAYTSVDAKKRADIVDTEIDLLDDRLDEIEHGQLVEKSDCKTYRESIQHQFKATEFAIRQDMPPPCWRRKIHDIELFLERKNIDFTVTEYCK